MNNIIIAFALALLFCTQINGLTGGGVQASHNSGATNSPYGTDAPFSSI